MLLYENYEQGRKTAKFEALAGTPFGGRGAGTLSGRQAHYRPGN